MSSILSEIAKETKGKSFNTYKYNVDGISMPSFDYDDHKQQIVWKKYGETLRQKESISLKSLADWLSTQQEPMFRYFLDGSRKVYKVDDMSYRNHVYPVMAGQVGVGCCERVNHTIQPAVFNGQRKFERSFVIALPDVAKENDWVDNKLCFNNLRGKINKQPHLQSRNLEFGAIRPYSTCLNDDGKVENKGIAVIQDYMVEREQEMVADLVKNRMLASNKYLIKDGTLEYRVVNIKNQIELKKFKDNYQFVVGVSKSFNPAHCVDKRGNNNSRLIADLPLYHRTPVNMYHSEQIGDVSFAVWFVRVRDSHYTTNAFDGILKIEKILVKDSQIEQGLESDEVDKITANIINERNPVCYGVDKRWANHLYPVYATESYVKSMYLSESMFLNLF